jgi:hypothetical protein
MSTPIPKSCLQEIEKIQRGFIWGDSEEGRKAHMIGWNQLTLPKNSGGLGFRKLNQMNDACLMKVCWLIRVGDKSLCAQVFRGKYGRNSIEHGEAKTCATDSAIWKSIGRLWPIMSGHHCWGIGNGTQIRFWEDIWIDKKMRLIDAIDTIPDDKREWRLCDVVTETGSWNYEELERLLPANLIMKLVARMPPTADVGPDVPLWPGEKMGNFSVASAYQLLTGGNLPDSEKKWNKVWRLDTLERIRVFMWQVLHDRIQTNWRTAKWNLTEPYCSHCGQMEETTLHVLRDCPIAVEVWKHLLKEDDRGSFFICTFQQWVELNLSTNMGIQSDLSWDATWATTCYWLWRWRNQRVHDSSYVSQWQPWSFILKLVNEYKATKSVIKAEQTCQKVVKDIKWLRPERGWTALILMVQRSVIPEWLSVEE